MYIIDPVQAQARANLLSKHFGEPGMLHGVDLTSGERYSHIDPLHPDAFFYQHVVGPSRTVEGQYALVGEDEKELCVGFFRPLCYLFDHEARLSAISIALHGQHGLRTPEQVLMCAKHLTAKGYPVIVERSFRIGLYVLWLLLSEKISSEAGSHIAYECYASLRDAGLVEEAGISVPLLEEGAHDVYVPYQFFAGGWWGQLYTVSDNKLVELNLREVPHLEPQSRQIRRLSMYEEAATLSSFVHAWWEKHGQRRVRAGDLVDLHPLPMEVEGSTRHALIIELGKTLSRISDQIIAGYIIRSRRSGNGSVCWLEPIESGENGSVDPADHDEGEQSAS